MPRFLAMILLALLALIGPSLAAGVCATHGGLPTTSVGGAEAPMRLPNPCELQGGKRVLPARPDFMRHIAIEDSRAVSAQWARGLMDDPGLEGRTPALELPPPRLA